MSLQEKLCNPFTPQFKKYICNLFGDTAEEIRNWSLLGVNCWQNYLITKGQCDLLWFILIHYTFSTAGNTAYSCPQSGDFDKWISFQMRNVILHFLMGSFTNQANDLQVGQVNNIKLAFNTSIHKRDLDTLRMMGARFVIVGIVGIILWLIYNRSWLLHSCTPKKL